VFGRTERSDIVINNDPMISSCHFRLSVTGDGCFVEDLQSTNGTLVNDQTVKSKVLSDGDRVKAGNSVFSMRLDSPDVLAANFPVEETPTSRERSPSEKALIEGERETCNDDVDETGESKKSLEVAPRAVSKDDSPPDLPRPTPAPPVAESDGAEEGAADDSIVASEFRVLLSRTASGAWLASQGPTSSVQPAGVMELLAIRCPVRLLVDVSSLDFAEALDEFPSLSEEPSASGGMRIVAGESVPVTDWVSAGWGKDAIVVLFSYVDPEPISSHLRAQLSSSSPGTIETTFRPSSLRSVLSTGAPDFVAEVLDPCEAVLLESPEFPENWVLYGNERLIDLLNTNSIPWSEEQTQ
jgi:hypothetical protein